MHASAGRQILARVKISYPRLQHLLVPLDFSGKSRQALRYAVPLAQKFSGRIHLVHVLPPARRTPAELAEAKQAAIRRLGQMSGTLPPRLRAGNAVLVGKPAGEIVALARRIAVDLIVLTTKGETGLRRALLGGTAQRIMQQAPCPVMSIRRR